MKKGLIAVTLLFTCYCSYAQKQGQQLIDSLLAELPMAKEDTNKVQILSDISHNYINSGPDKGIRYGKEALVLAEKLHWLKGIALSNNALGSNYTVKAEYEAGYRYGLNALKANEQLGDQRGIATSYSRIATVFYYQGDLDKALQYFELSFQTATKAGLKPAMATAMTNIGSVYGTKKEYARARKYIEQALAIDRELNRKNNIVVSLVSLGNLHAETRDYGLALKHFQEAAQLAYEIGDKSNMAVNLGNAANMYLKMSHDTVGNDGSRRITNINAVYVQKAIIGFKKAIDIILELGDLRLAENFYGCLHDAYRLNGDHKLALEALDKVIKLKDSVYNKESKEAIAKLELQSQYEKKQLADSLKMAEAKKQAAFQLHRQKNYTYLGIAGIVLLAGVTVYILRNNRRLTAEKAKSEELLLNILPDEVSDELKKRGATTAKSFDDVTILFTDFVNFTGAGERMGSQQLVEELHNCFKAFDDIVGRYNIEKIKTIGDAYLAVCGAPVRDEKHAERVANAAIEIRDFMIQRKAELGDRTFDIRIGIHSGGVVAGIVGVKKFSYDIWGDAVNTAARMEQNSFSGKINISHTTYELLKDKFSCKYRGEIDAKNKGMLRMYFLEKMDNEPADADRVGTASLQSS